MHAKNCRLAAVVALICLSAACKPQSPPADGVPSPSTSPESTSQADAPAAAAPAIPTDVVFSVDPGNVYACEGRDRTTSLVKWSVSRPGVNSVKVLVSSVEDPEPKTLAVMSPIGEAKTGNWMTAGVTVQLVDAETGAELAKHVVTALPCQ